MGRVLIASGDIAVGEQLSVRLLSAEVSCDVAPAGNDVLDHLREGNYDLMLLDLELTQVDAHAVLESLRQMRPERRPVVLAAGSRENSRALDVDVVQMILRKPLRFSDVAEMICSCVRQRGERRTAWPADRSASSAFSNRSPFTSR